MLRRLSRGGTAAAALVGALALGLLAFTVLGVGGGTPGPVAPAKGDATVYVPGRATSEVARASETLGLREGQGGGAEHAPVLAEHQPIAPARFDGPIAAYRRYAAGQVRALAPQAATLTAAVARGDRTAARTAWRAAYARYLRLGAVYGAFGDLDAAIDGLPGGLPRGDRDPGFTGLHRVEQVLWTAAPVRDARPATLRLQRDVVRLRRAVPRTEITSLDYATRAHEILEDAQRDFLSGTSVPWSGEGVLATASAATATAEVLRTLDPLLRGAQSHTLTAVGVQRLQHEIAAITAAHGGRVPALGELSHPERQRLNAATAWALEQLQALPDDLATEDAPAVPELKEHR